MKENLEKSSAIHPTTEAVGFLAGWNRETIDEIKRKTDMYVNAYIIGDLLEYCVKNNIHFEFDSSDVNIQFIDYLYNLVNNDLIEKK